MLKKSLFMVIGNVRAHIAFIKGSYLPVIFCFSFFFLAFIWMYMTLGTVSSGDDHFFHFRFAEQMRDHGVLDSFKDFKAIYFSRSAQGNDYFIYYNFLFYLVIIPFTYIQPLFLGIKLYAVCAASISFTILYWVLKRLEIKRAFLWSMAVFGVFATNLMFRLFSSRPFTLAPALLLLLLYFLHRKNYLGVFTICLLYLFWHSSTFFLPIIIILTYFVFEKFYGQKGDVKNLVFGFLGSLASLGLVYLIAPGFFVFIYDTVFGIYKETILGKAVKIPEGNELYPVPFFNFINGNYVVICALIICTSVFVYRYVMTKVGGIDSEVIESNPNVLANRALIGSAFVLTTLFFLGTVVASARFEDYFVFFGALFIIVYLSEVSSFVKIGNALIVKAVMAGIIISICYLFLNNLLSLRNMISRGASVETWRPIGEWLNQNVPKGEVVFNTSWNWFPQLYYHSPSHNYIVGLEPRFLYVYDKKLYWEWYNIGAKAYVCPEESCPELDKIKDSLGKKKVLLDKWYKDNGVRIANVLLKDFHSSYIISAKYYESLNAVLDNSDRFEKKFSSLNELYIYQVK